MKISLRFLPIALFFIFYALIQVSFTSLRQFQEAKDEKDNTAIQEIVVDRFNRFLEFPYMLTMLGSHYLGEGKLRTANYEKYAGYMMESNPEFLGFNVMDEKGVIIRIFPTESNAKALGRISQKLGPVLESYKKGENFYLSSPFRLFQGQQGFVFYAPVKSGQKLDGWYAIVISSEAFLRKFALDDFLSVFELVIYDETSGRDFFATSIVPTEGTRVFSTSKELYGRKMVFKSWRKNEAQIYTYPWYFSVIIALILSLASALMLRLHAQRKKASSQLENIGLLLRVTSKEALSNLIEIHSEFNRLNLPEGEDVERLSRDINYLTNLVEQIDLLQTMAHTGEGLSDNNQSFIQLIRNQIEVFSDVFEKKNIRVFFNEKDFHNIAIKANIWLLENSVLSNVFSHLLIHIKEGTELKIENHSTAQRQVVKFRIKRQHTNEQAKIQTRRMVVAKKVIQLHQGDLFEDINDDELVISLVCSHI